MGVELPYLHAFGPTLAAPVAARLMCSPSAGEMEVPFSARFLLGRSGRNPDGRLVEGLQMSRPAQGAPKAAAASSDDASSPAAVPEESPVVDETGFDEGGGHHKAPRGTTDAGTSARPFPHLPVMVGEVVALLAPVPPGVVVDATVGGGGHARAILDAHRHLRVIGLDQDPDAVAAARRALARYGERAVVHRARFDDLAEVLEQAGVTQLSGALFDLGVSSPQLDRAERGFSFRADGPIDMRMDPSLGTSAGDLVNTLPESALADLFRSNGEGRLSGRIARAIVASRPLSSTQELADVVASAVPAAVRRKGHPARRVFQALRIEVNDELGELAAALPVALSSLAVGGVCAVISYHSG
jgi:16S rRNA (cytosine1402-N4)-methyltransferase